MSGRHVAVVGATGLVGRTTVSLLCADPHIATVHVLSRRPLAASHPKLVQHVVDFSRLADFDWPACDTLFCCLGTTIRAAGSRQAFRAVDHDMVLSAARTARDAGAQTLAVVSAMGANPRSGVFYNRVKGEMEAAVAGLGYRSVLLFRPSLLTGERADRRPMEHAAQLFFRCFDRLLPNRYRALPGSAVASAMLALTAAPPPGITIVESDRIRELSLSVSQ
jgi:uncharacterized protein YbjT (DUF2867 family)